MPTDSTTTLANLVRADADRNLSYRGLQRRAQASDIPKLLVDLRFLPVLLVRLSSVRGPVALIATLVNRLLFGVEVARQTKIGPGL